GTLGGSNTVTAAAGATFTGASNTMIFAGRSLNLGGTTSTWSGGTITIDNDSVLTNNFSSTFTATGNNSIQRSSSVGTATFVNQGTFRKDTGTGTTTLGGAITFTNSGSVEVVTGTLAIGSNLSNSGTVTAAS